MSGEVDFKFDGLDDFKNQLAKVAEEYPGTAEKHLKKIGNRFKKKLKDASPESDKSSKKKLKDSWKTKVSGLSGTDLQVEIWTTSPHFHLIDRGHKIVTKSGKVVGFKQGLHFLESTAQDVEANDIPAELEKLMNEITKKIGD